MSGAFEQDATTRVAASDRGERALVVELVVVDGPSRGKRIEVTGGTARIGTAPANALRLDDSTVSRVHCEVRVRRDVINVRDCGSTNGVYVEGVRLLEGDVPPGALLRIGHSVVRVEAGNASVYVPLSNSDSFGELVGSSVEMRKLYAILERVALTDTTVLITGETGTGKDVVARALHSASPRARGPFVPIDCGALPEALFESELFGHARGAFSGAVADRKGAFEEANGGTLFLDEVGELPHVVQSKLLRAIETRSVRRVGTNTARPIDVRILAATNRPLERAINDGAFREDLYYRLAVVEARVPPLRARRDDIPMLAEKLYQPRAQPNSHLPHEFVARLSARPWPGNVRELRNYIERSASLGLLEGESAPLSYVAPRGSLEGLVPLHLPLKEARDAWTASFEGMYVRALLAKTGGNVTHAAEAAGVNRRFLQRLMSRLGMQTAARDDDG